MKKDKRTGFEKIWGRKSKWSEPENTSRVIKITAYNIPTEDEPRIIIKKTDGKPKLITKLILIRLKSLLRPFYSK